MKKLVVGVGIVLAVLLLGNLILFSPLTANRSDLFKEFPLSVKEYLNLHMRVAAVGLMQHMEHARMLFIEVRPAEAESDIELHIVWLGGGSLHATRAERENVAKAMVGVLEDALMNLYMFSSWGADPEITLVQFVAGSEGDNEISRRTHVFSTAEFKRYNTRPLR